MVKRILKKITPRFLLSGYHWSWALFSALVYRFPSRRLTVIGVTGTNGKSTTTRLIAEILKEAGKKVAVASSIDFEILGETRKNKMKMTMPGRGYIQKFLREAVEKEVDVVVLEVTSEGVKQFRHKFIDFDVAVFTNLSPEHIESHGGFENYKRAKGRFFKAVSGVHVLNFDDEHFDYFSSFDAEKRYGYGFEKEPENCEVIIKGKKLISGPEGIEFEVDQELFKMSLLGKFNAYNGLAALAVADYLEVDRKTVKKALEKIVGIPGRMEKVIEEPFTVFIDYAFTPNALEKVYQDLYEKCDAKMIVVLGACGGGRDKWKRPVLGEIAAEYADTIIVTNEDPYDEDPNKIIEDVARGAGEKAVKVKDRREAIGKALRAAEKGDVVVVTGKGSESWMQLKNGKKIPWNERKVIEEELKKI